jgi:hypothetical protein
VPEIILLKRVPTKAKNDAFCEVLYNVKQFLVMDMDKIADEEKKSCGKIRLDILKGRSID